MNARAPRIHPSGLHDPDSRCTVQNIGPWEVRVYAWNDPRHRYLAPRGSLHLQLWAPCFGVSMLVPSRLTENCWDLWTEGTVVRVCCLLHLREICRERALPQPPCPGALVPAMRRFVLAPALGAVLRPDERKDAFPATL